MQGLSVARPARARHRHELRTLVYATLDEANGGIIRNLTHEGIALQAVVAARPGQPLQVRFELARPRLRVETRGEVIWADSAGQCGIRFLDLPPRTARRIDEWIFGDLLERAPLYSQHTGSVFSATATRLDAAEDDGLILSPSPVKVIELPLGPEAIRGDAQPSVEETTEETTELGWLSRPLSRRSLTWLVNALTMFAALLLFALVFLFVTREVPKRPLVMAAGAVVAVAVLFWGFFGVFGGASPGARLARLAGYDTEEEEEREGARFR